MKVLLLNGSPKPNGNTNRALEEVAKTLQAEGIDTEILHVASKVTRGCIGCGGCKGTGRCVFGDEDMVNEALAKMEQADGLIIGSPVYFASPNGTLISFLDRFFYAGKCFTHKPAAAISVARRAGTVASFAHHAGSNLLDEGVEGADNAFTSSAGDCFINVRNIRENVCGDIAYT